MPMQSFQPQELVPAKPERIQVPTSASSVALPPPAPPSLLRVYVQEAIKRKKLLIAWAAATAVVIALVLLVFARPVYRAEGKLSYRPNYSRGPKPIYTPPNIQSTVQILKSPEVLEPVRQQRLPKMSKEDFTAAVRVEVSKQSEFIDVDFDYPNPTIAAAVANDLMTEGLRYFADVRVQTTKDSIVQAQHDLQAAKKQHENAKSEYRRVHEARGVADPEVELDTLRSSLAGIETQLLATRQRHANLKLEVTYLEARRDAPADPSDNTFDETFFPVLQSMMNELQSKLTNEKELAAARVKLEAAKVEEQAQRPLMLKGIIPRIEYDRIVAEIRVQEATLKQGEETKQLRADLQKKYEELKKKAASNKPARRAIIDELERTKKEVSTLPGTIEVLTGELNAKKKALADLIGLKRELGEKDDNIKLLWTRVQDFHAQLTDAAERSQDLNANDLRVHAAAAAGATPHSTNAPKLGLALLGASAFLLVGYLSLFALPQLSAAQAVAGGPPALPKALIALVPYTRKSNGNAGALPAPGPQSPPVVQALAERIEQEGVDPGGIVLFTPTIEQLQVVPVMGDLGTVFSRRGDKVLVFDARHAAETPGWAGPNATAVAATVERYLGGQTANATECFVPTALDGVEYSRADLATNVTGVMAAHRFRQLVEEMRERYSLVFVVGPPVQLDAGEALLGTLAEGMVLVTETTADPIEVHAYLDTLCQQVPARLYGTLSVPRA